MSVIERSDLLFSTFVIGVVDLTQAITPILVYIYWAADWVKENADLGIYFEG